MRKGKGNSIEMRLIRKVIKAIPADVLESLVEDWMRVWIKHNNIKT